MERIFSKALAAAIEPRSYANGGGSGAFGANNSRDLMNRSAMVSPGKRKFSPPDLIRVTVNDKEEFRQKQLSADGTWDDSHAMYIGQIGVVARNRERGMCDVLFVHRIGSDLDLNQLIGIVGTTDDKKIAFVSLELHESCFGLCLAGCWFPGDMAVVFPHAHYLKMTNGHKADFAVLGKWAGRLVMVNAVTDGMVSVICIEEDQGSVDTIEVTPPSLVPVLISSSATQRVERWRNNDVEIRVAPIFKNRLPRPNDLRLLYESITQSRNAARVEHFVKEFVGAVDVPIGENGETALMYAIVFDDLDIVNLLLQAGASPIQTNNVGIPAFHFFFSERPPPSQLGSMDILERLIEHCKPKLSAVVDGNRRTLLHMAIENKHSAALCRLLEFADLDVNAQDHLLRTALHYVADNKEMDFELLDMGSRLLNKGADVLIYDSNWFSPLHRCAMHGNRKLLFEMMENRLPHGDVEKPNDGWTPLHLAAVAGHVVVVEELIGNLWCNIDTLTKDGQSVLHLLHSALQSQLYKWMKPGLSHPAVPSCGLFHVYESIVRSSSNSDLNVYTENHGTPLHFAFQQLCLAIASSGGKQPHPQLIAQLYALEKSSEEMSLTNDLLPICSSWPQLAIVCFLLCKGASVKQKNPQDMTIFEMAVVDLRCLIFYFHKLSSDDRNRMGTECLFCDNRSNVYLKPCQHLAPFCDDCATRDSALALPKCPTCRKPIVDRIDLDGKAIAKFTGSATEDDRARLKKLKEIEERLVCPICLDREKSIRLNCEHFLCDVCSERVSICPVCREFIMSRTKTFI